MRWYNTEIMKKIIFVCLLFIFIFNIAFLTAASLREEVCLNGEWVFHGGGPRETEPVPSTEIDWATIRVPGSWYYRPLNYTTRDWTSFHYGWYKLPISIPSRWSGRRIKIYFERVNHYACIFINNEKVGEHQESFTPFEVDITTFVTLGGTDTLYIYNEDSWRSAYPTSGSAPAMASPTGLMSDYNTYTVATGDYIMRNFNYNSMYTGVYTGFGDLEKGVWGNVFLKSYNPVYVEDVFVVTSVRTKKITAKVYVRNDDNAAHTVNIVNNVMKDGQVKFTVSDNPQEVTNADLTTESRAGASTTITVPARSSKCIEVSKTPWDNSIKLWGIGKAKIKNGNSFEYIDYGNPILYFLATSLEENGQTIDTKYIRFGFREIWVYNPTDTTDSYSYPYGKYDYHFYLNGKRIFFQAACLDHAHESFCYNRQNIIVLYRSEMGRNHNFIRLHCFSPSKIWFDVADELGILVVPESHSRNNANSPSIYCKAQNSYTAYGVTLSQGQAVTDATARWISNMTKYYHEYTKAHRNHPSIAMWSNGNEIYQKEQDGNSYTQRAARQGRTETFMQFDREAIRPADPTRKIASSGVSRFINFDGTKCTFDDTIAPGHSSEIDMVDIRKIFVYEAPERKEWPFTAAQAYTDWQTNFKRPVMNTEEELDVVSLDFINISNPTYGVGGTVYNGYMAWSNFFYIDSNPSTKFTYVSPARTYTNIGNCIARAAYYQIPRFNTFGVPIRDAWLQGSEVVFGSSYSSPNIIWPSMSGEGVKARYLFPGSTRTTYNWFDSTKALYKTNFLFDRIRDGFANCPPYGAMPKFYEPGWYSDTAFISGLTRVPEIVVTLKNNGVIMPNAFVYVEPNQGQSAPPTGVMTDTTGKAWFTLKESGGYKLVYYSGGSSISLPVMTSYTLYKDWTTGGYNYIQTIDFDIANILPPDTTAPDKISNLSIISKSSETVTLGWTSAGDDTNLGTASAYDIRYMANLPITSGNFNNAVRCFGVPTPQAAGNSESYTVNNLANGTTYYFAIKVGDEIPNWSIISNIISEKTLGISNDTTPPNAIMNFTATVISTQTITVTWTATGDDGETGTSSEYDIRYRTDSIDINNWSTSTQCSGEPVPGISGTNVSYTINGLTKDTTYYIAIKAKDAALNWSDISNVIVIKTLTGIPGPVNYLSAIPSASATIQLTWVKSINDNIANYKIFIAAGSNAFDYTIPNYVVSSTVTSFEINNLTAEQEYKFVIRAVDTQGNEDTNTNIISETAVNSLSNINAVCRLSEPSNGMKISGNQLTIIADTILGNIEGIANVEFEYRKVGDTDWTKISAVDTVTPNPDTTSPYSIKWDTNGLDPNLQYNLRVVTTYKDGSKDTKPGYITISIDNSDPDIQETNTTKSMRIDNRRHNIINISIPNYDLLAQVVISSGILSNTTDKISIEINPANVPAITSNLALVENIFKIELISGQTQFDNDIEIILPYIDNNNDNIEDNKDITNTKLEVYTSRSLKSKWEKVTTTTLDKTNKQLTAKTKHLSYYAIFAVLQSDLNTAHVYPNPFKPSLGHTKIFFTNLTTRTKIKIFNLAGELIYEDEKDTPAGELSWDVKNNKGKPIASGVYIYMITNDNDQTKKGKLAIIR